VGVQGFLDSSQPANGGFTPDPGYTELAFTGTPSGNSGNGNGTLFPEYQAVSATGNYQASGTLSSNAGGLSATDLATDRADLTDHFALLAPATAGAGVPFTITVSAKDVNGNTVTGYTGTVHFTSSDTASGVLLPGDYTFTTADQGTHTFSVTLQTN